MFKLAVEVIKLKHQEMGFKLVEVILGCKVDWQVEFVLDLNHIVQI